jgi:hypothetical protein
MPDQSTPPRRRLNLLLDLGADDLTELCHALRVLANDLEHDEREVREQTSGGYASGHHLSLTCVPEMTGDRFRAELADWMKARADA